MSVIKVDRTRPYSMTIGWGRGTEYHQDGKTFDSEYCLIESDEPSQDQPKEKRKPGRPKKVKAESLISDANLLAMASMAMETPKGLFAELGVYKGGSAFVLSEIAEKQGRELHLFDTFTGMPIYEDGDSHQVGEFSDTSLSEVTKLVPSAKFHVGVFPETMPEGMGKVAFLHIDADQYRSYIDAIDRFSPLMVKGGVMWFDDADCLKSAAKAVEEKFGKRVETHKCGKKFVRF